MRILAALGWLLLFCLAAAGAGGLVIGIARRTHAVAHGASLSLLTALACTAALALLLAWFALLLGGGLAGTARRGPARFGIRQGLVMAAGFPLAVVAGAGLAYVVALLAALYAGAPFWALHAIGSAPALMRSGIVAGYAAGILFALVYARKRAGGRLADGGATGLAWRAPARGGYPAAVLAAIVVVALAIGVMRLIPPAPHAGALTMARAFGGSAAGLACFAAIVVVAAPLAEEYVFRGFVFAAFAGRLGVVGSALLTTALFVGLHAPEKLHYLPGFADVALMALAATWLRCRYRSIRPGMVLHMLYNAGVIVFSALLIRPPH